MSMCYLATVGKYMRLLALGYRDLMLTDAIVSNTSLETLHIKTSRRPDPVAIRRDLDRPTESAHGLAVLNHAIHLVPTTMASRHMCVLNTCMEVGSGWKHARYF